MKKFMTRILSVVIIAALLTVVSVAPFSALTLYTSGHYTYADIDERYVALYDYDNSSPTLVVPDMYNQRYIRSIYDYAFENNTEITGLDFSQSSKVASIGINAFAGCKNLSGKLVLPSSVSTIGDAAFQGCSSLSEVTINCTVSEIPQQGFNRCTDLEKVSLPITAKTIGNLAFANCPNLKEVFVPSSVRSISSSAFQNSGSVVIRCFYESYAYNYAKQNNIPYALISNYPLGDSNCDGDVNILDVTRIQKYRAGIIDLNELELLNADVNGDGEVTIRDATLIQMYCAGRITKF